MRILFSAMLALWLGFPAVGAWGLSSEPVDSANVTSTLVSAADAAVPGQTLRLGLWLEHEPKWHTYWTNPGAAGLTTKLTWTLPDGVAAGEIRWPTPIKFGQELQIIGYGYEGTVLLPVDIAVPADFAGDVLELSVKVTYLACEEACIPGRAEHALRVPVIASGETVSASEHAKQFEAAEAARPVDLKGRDEGAGERAWPDGDGTLRLAVPAEAVDAIGGADAIETNPAYGPEFLPAVLGQFDGLAEQSPARATDASGRSWWTLTATPSEDADAVEIVEGLIAWGPKGTRRSIAVRAEVGEPLVLTAGTEATAPAATEFADEAGVDRGLLAILGFAVVGGLILNLMPCVFPVLALKITAFIGQAGESRAAVLRHGLAFGIGVLVSFWVIAAAVLAIKAGGQEIGWGFQLQNPIFVGAMAIVIFAVGLNFAGLFDIGVGVMNAAGKASGKVEGTGGLASSFGSGVLATALATPCSAPFLAGSVGYAMTSPPATLFAVLTAMGVGMALPYVLLSAFPSWLGVLPRPGAWMETFKQLMAFPMFAVAAWLVWVFNGQTAAMGAGFGLPGMFAALLLLAMGLWALGRFGVPSRSAGVRWAGRLACVALLAGSAATVAWAGAPSSDEKLDWQDWSPAAVAAARAEGRPVFVDFTADWCATCKFNERVFIDVAEVRDVVDRDNVAVFKADWTNHDDAITEALAEFGVASVPYYVFYAPDGDSEPVHFESVFSTGKILDTLAAVTPDG